MNRRNFLIGATALPVGCAGPQNLRWDEDVTLKDARTISVGLEFDYERIGGPPLAVLGESLYILRRTTLAFKPIPFSELYTVSFEKHHLNMIEYYEGSWYFLLQRRGDYPMRQGSKGLEVIWGYDQNSTGHKLWRLGSDGLRQSSLEAIPAQVLRTNLLMDYAPMSVLRQLDGTRVSLQKKAAIDQLYPLNPSDLHISVPSNLSKEGTK